MDNKLALTIQCPFCHALPGTPCRTMKKGGGKADHTHQRRLAAAKDITAFKASINPTPSAQQAQAPTPNLPDPRTLTNRIAIVVDASGSMRHLTNKVLQVFNNQLDTIKNQMIQTGIKTFVSLYTFSYARCIKPVILNADPMLLQPLSYGNYNADGQTALLDAIAVATRGLDSFAVNNDPGCSFLVIVITDGAENDSYEFSPNRGGREAIKAMIEERQRTDRWTFSFMVPPNATREITGFGVPIGNVIEWEASEAGLQAVGSYTAGGISNYFTGRTKGIRSTNTFYANLANVSQQDLDKLTDLSQQFYRWVVPPTADGKIPIKAFVNSMIAKDRGVAQKLGYFKEGHGYYQLTKSEEVQETKDFAIFDKKTGSIFGGDEARALANIPRHSRIRVRPGDFKDYELFIRSDSNNRNLISGTVFLYRI